MDEHRERHPGHLAKPYDIPLLIRLYGLESNTRRSGKLALREAASFAQAREIGFGTPVSCEHVIESFAKDADVGLMKRVVELDYVAKG